MDFQQIALHLIDLIFTIIPALFIVSFPFLILYTIYHMVKSLIRYNARIKAEAEAHNREHEHADAGTGTE